MQKIELTKNKYTLVSDEDVEFVRKFKWHATNNSRPWHSIEKWYAARNTTLADGARRKAYLHRAIMQRILHVQGVEDVEAEMLDKVVDHADGDGLNNQRENLWLIDKAANIVPQVLIHNQPRVKRKNAKAKKGFRRTKKEILK